MENQDRYIGTHLALDLISNNSDLLRNQGLMSQYLSEIIELAEMTCLRAPETFTFPYASEYTRFLDKLREEGTSSTLIDEAQSFLDYNRTEGSGVTGTAVLCESHVASHSFPEKVEPFISICLYSCKSFNTDKILEYTKKFWDAKLIHGSIIERYIGLPQEITQIKIGE